MSRSTLLVPALILAAAAGAARTAEAQLPFDMPIRAERGTMLAHSNAIALKDTRTWNALDGRLPWSEIVGSPMGTIVNRGSSPVRLVLFLRPGRVGDKVHHHGQTVRVSGGEGRYHVAVVPEGFEFDVGASDTPIWHSRLVAPGERVRLADLPPVNARGVMAMMRERPFQVAVLAMAEKGTLAMTIAGFAPLNTEIFSRDMPRSGSFIPGDHFIPGDQFLPGDQFIPGDQFLSGSLR